VEKEEKYKVTVSFSIHVENVPEMDVQKLKQQINTLLLELTSMYKPEDITINLYWY